MPKQCPGSRWPRSFLQVDGLVAFPLDGCWPRLLGNVREARSQRPGCPPQSLALPGPRVVHLPGAAGCHFISFLPWERDASQYFFFNQVPIPRWILIALCLAATILQTYSDTLGLLLSHPPHAPTPGNGDCKPCFL